MAPVLMAAVQPGLDGVDGGVDGGINAAGNTDETGPVGRLGCRQNRRCGRAAHATVNLRRNTE
jgi:hypothetical protein